MVSGMAAGAYLSGIMRDRIHVQAPAKLNLALSVGAPGADGMHPIAGWMATVDLHDDLELVRLPVGYPSRYAIIWHDEARRTSDIDWSIRRDLGARAHDALERHVGRGLSVQAKFEKRIPIGGGLGGGSADAAAMLHGLNRLFDLGLPVDELATIAEPLGSDVPFLVHGGSAIVTGLGERIERLPSPEALHAVLVLPKISCGTGPVYRTFDELRPDARVDEARVRSVSVAAITTSSPFNDLAEPACHLHPELGQLRAELADAVGMPVHVSGSGSTLFVVVDSELTANLIAETVETRFELPAISVRASEGTLTGDTVRDDTP
jgi:4-diphosphocytidyl-2-C-methyl-D-erythritol kinase